MFYLAKNSNIASEGIISLEPSKYFLYIVNTPKCVSFPEAQICFALTCIPWRHACTWLQLDIFWFRRSLNMNDTGNAVSIFVIIDYEYSPSHCMCYEASSTAYQITLYSSHQLCCCYWEISAKNSSFPTNHGALLLTRLSCIDNTMKHEHTSGRVSAHACG